jgi:hypothetical protein
VQEPDEQQQAKNSTPLSDLLTDMIVEMRLARLSQPVAGPPSFDGLLLQSFPDLFYKMVSDMPDVPAPASTDEQDESGDASTVAADSASLPAGSRAGSLSAAAGPASWMWDTMYWGSASGAAAVCVCVCVCCVCVCVCVCVCRRLLCPLLVHSVGMSVFMFAVRCCGNRLLQRALLPLLQAPRLAAAQSDRQPDTQSADGGPRSHRRASSLGAMNSAVGAAAPKGSPTPTRASVAITSPLFSRRGARALRTAGSPRMPAKGSGVQRSVPDNLSLATDADRPLAQTLAQLARSCESVNIIEEPDEAAAAAVIESEAEMAANGDAVEREERRPSASSQQRRQEEGEDKGHVQATSRDQSLSLEASPVQASAGDVPQDGDASVRAAPAGLESDMQPSATGSTDAQEESEQRKQDAAGTSTVHASQGDAEESMSPAAEAITDPRSQSATETLSDADSPDLKEKLQDAPASTKVEVVSGDSANVAQPTDRSDEQAGSAGHDTPTHTSPAGNDADTQASTGESHGRPWAPELTVTTPSPEKTLDMAGRLSPSVLRRTSSTSASPAPPSPVRSPGPLRSLAMHSPPAWDAVARASPRAVRDGPLTPTRQLRDQFVFEKVRRGSEGAAHVAAAEQAATSEWRASDAVVPARALHSPAPPAAATPATSVSHDTTVSSQDSPLTPPMPDSPPRPALRQPSERTLARQDALLAAMSAAPPTAASDSPLPPLSPTPVAAMETKPRQPTNGPSSSKSFNPFASARNGPAGSHLVKEGKLPVSSPIVPSFNPSPPAQEAHPGQQPVSSGSAAAIEEEGLLSPALLAAGPSRPRHTLAFGRSESLPVPGADTCTSPGSPLTRMAGSGPSSPVAPSSPFGVHAMPAFRDSPPPPLIPGSPRVPSRLADVTRAAARTLSLAHEDAPLSPTLAEQVEFI